MPADHAPPQSLARSQPVGLRLSRDMAWFAAACAGWWLVARWQPAPWIAASLGVAACLSLCKALAMRPLLRPFAALAALVPALSAPGMPADAAAGGLLLAGCGYSAFTLLRLAFHFAIAHRFRLPGGEDDGWDYGRILQTQYQLLGRLQPRRRQRVLFPPTDMEAVLREATRRGGDLACFAEFSPSSIRSHDLVVPLTLADSERLRDFAGLLHRNPLPLPDAGCVALCNDKLACNRALAAAGFAANVPEIADSLPFPYVLKKRIDAWGDNTHVIADPGDERRFAALLSDPDYFRQAFVPGQREYAAHLLVRGGRIVAALTVEYGFAHDLHKKCREQPPHYRRLRRPAHLPLLRDMLAAIGYEGLCCVNYKLQDGRVRLLEINPRFGASLAPWFFVMARALRHAPRARFRASATTSAASPTGA